MKLPLLQRHECVKLPLLQQYECVKLPLLQQYECVKLPVLQLNGGVKMPCYISLFYQESSPIFPRAGRPSSRRAAYSEDDGTDRRDDAARAHGWA